jgi:hypothetical protein
MAKTKTKSMEEVYAASQKKYDEGIDGWIDANVAQQEACDSLKALCDRERKMYRPSRFEFFVAAALTGLLSGPEFYGSVSKQAVAHAKATISAIDSELKTKKGKE